MKKQDKNTEVFKRKHMGKTSKVALCGCLLGFALILGYIEFLFPFHFGVPGIKLGLANLAVLLCLYLFGCPTALLICVLRILLSAVLFGNSFSFLYSLAGGLLAFGTMVLMKRLKGIGASGVSICGGVFHNIGQLFMAYFVLREGVIFFYIPILILAGALTGALNGIIISLVLKRMHRMED